MAACLLACDATGNARTGDPRHSRSSGCRASVPDPGPGEVEVAIAVGGICGSDLHYYHDGGVGDFKLREPMILGHEVVGRIARLGSGVTGLQEGMRVGIHPARYCGACGYCVSGRANICADVRFLGSAGRFPHVKGGFSNHLVVSAEQIVPIPDHLSFEQAVFAEPLAVGLHAIRRADDVRGRSVLITGAGPIGAMVILAAVHAGAARIIVTDIVDEPLVVARQLGAADAINVLRSVDPLSDVDFAIEASGSGAGVSTCLNALQRCGRLVLVGMPSGAPPTPLFQGGEPRDRRRGLVPVHHRVRRGGRRAGHRSRHNTAPLGQLCP